MAQSRVDQVWPAIARMVIAETVTMILTLLAVAPALAQDEVSLRAADRAQLDAARAGDADAIASITLPTFIINNPLGETGTGDRMIQRFRSGEIAIERLARVIERTAITGDVGVVMGREVVEHAPTSLEGRGERRGPILRRFTHVWLWRDGNWRWLARHASERPKPTSPADRATGFE